MGPRFAASHGGTDILFDSQSLTPLSRSRSATGEILFSNVCYFFIEINLTPWFAWD